MQKSPEMKRQAHRQATYRQPQLTDAVQHLPVPARGFRLRMRVNLILLAVVIGAGYAIAQLF